MAVWITREFFAYREVLGVVLRSDRWRRGLRGMNAGHPDGIGSAGVPECARADAVGASHHLGSRRVANVADVDTTDGVVGCAP